MRFSSLLVATLILACSHMDSSAQDNWFIELGFGPGEMERAPSTLYDGLVFRPLGGSSCLFPVNVNPCVQDETIASPSLGNGEVSNFAIGWQFHQFWSLEVSFLNFSDFTNERIDSFQAGPYSSSFIDSELQGFNLSLSGHLDVTDSLLVFGKIGAFGYESEIEETASLLTRDTFIPGIARADLTPDTDVQNGPMMVNNFIKDDGAALSFGAGIAYKITSSLQLRAEYRALPNINDLDVDAVTLGLRYQF